MVKVFTGTQNEYYMDGYLKQNLDVAKKVIKKDWDMVFVVDGSEGAGKSVMTQQLAYYLANNLKLENITFKPEQFQESILKSKKYDAVVYDEGYTGLSSRATMSLINKTLISMLAEIRQKNLFVFVVVPTFFDLDKYVALWRSRALIHIYTTKRFERGFFAFYNIDKKKELYMKGKKFYSYRDPRPNFIGRFTNHYTVNEMDYRKKKLESLSDREESYGKPELIKNIMLNIKNHLKTQNLTNKDIADLCNVSRQSLWRYKKDLAESVTADFVMP